MTSSPCTLTGGLDNLQAGGPGLVDLGVARSHSRLHVSNDNPSTEAKLKTLKYCPAFPGRFGSIEAPGRLRKVL